MADVGILLKAKDEASGPIKNVKSSLNELGKAAGEATTLSGAFTQLGGAIGIAAAAAGAFKLGQVVVDMAQVSAQAQRVEQSFNTLASQAGISGDALLSAMQKASGGTIANTELMLTANRALALGVADNANEISQLMQVAIARGKALGLSAQQAFSDLVTGIGRMSPLILDNLGIITGGQKVFDDYAASIGRSAASLTDAERKQALVNKVISESADLVRQNTAAGNDAASSFERAAASWQNIKSVVDEIVLPSVEPWLVSLADGLDRLNESLDKTQQLSGLVQAKQNVSGGGQPSTDAEYYLKVAQAAQSAGDSAKQLANDQAALAATIMGQTSPSMKSLALDAYQVEAGLRAASAGMVNQQAAAANLGASLAVLGGEYQRVIALQNAFAGQSAALSGLAGQVISAAGQETGLKFLRQANAELSVQQKAWQDAGYSVAEVNALSYAYSDNLRKSTEETYGFGAAATKANRAAAAAVKALNAEYEDLKSKVAGVIDSAFSDTAGVNPDDILPRQDSISEDARRLADVAVNGFASPWADYLANKFPDTIGAAFANGGDVKQTAAQLLKDFQDGLRPELLDKNRAKELVKRDIIGEQNMKALTDEIAKELASEMGISVAQAQQAAVSALGGGATGVGAATPDSKQVPIVPVIDTSQLPTTPIAISGTITKITASITSEDAQSVSTIISGKLSVTVTPKLGEISSAEIQTFKETLTARLNEQRGTTLELGKIYSGGSLLTIKPTIDTSGITKDSLIPVGVKDTPIPLLGSVTEVSLSPTVTVPDVTLVGTITYVYAAVTSENASAISTDISSKLVISTTPTLNDVPSDVIQTFKENLTARLNEQRGTTLELGKIYDTNAGDLLAITPTIDTTGVDVSTPLAYLEQELAPIVTPYINYLGILPEELTAAGTHIASGIADGIAKYNLGNAIITELNKAQLAMRNAGITNGQNWGAGFNSGATEYITSIVSTVVTLALAQMTKNTTRTGAQG